MAGLLINNQMFMRLADHFRANNLGIAPYEISE